MARLVDFLYPVNPPKRTRTSDKPIAVLALGLSRSGTDSLREALIQLGYSKCYHGFCLADEDWADSRAWYDLLAHKYYPGSPSSHIDNAITTASFNAILGNCMAITDIPAVLFGSELVAAYPDAKVILNHRSDLKEWEESFRTTTYAAERPWLIYFLSFFTKELFWMEQVFIMIVDVLFHGHFETNAKEVYTSHYQNLETILKDSKRPYLKWEVQHGWKPLCELLGKEVPDMEFPRRNVRKNHDKIIGRLLKVRIQKAMWNAALIFGTMVVACIAVWFGTGRL